MNEKLSNVKFDGAATVAVNEVPKNEENTSWFNTTMNKAKEGATDTFKNVTDELKAIKAKFVAVAARIRPIAKKVSRTIWFYLIFALAINAIANFCWPELPEKIPMIWAFCNGTLELMDGMFKIVFEFIKGIVTWDSITAFHKIGDIMGGLWAEFINWIASI